MISTTATGCTTNDTATAFTHWSTGEVLASMRVKFGGRMPDDACVCAGAGVQLEQRGFVGVVC